MLLYIRYTEQDMPIPSATTSPKTQVNMRFSPELLSKLDAYSEMVGQSKTQIAANAIEDYLDWRIPQIADLKLAIAAADRGEFATDEQVEAIFKKHGA
jgi:RHH-type transcriptional regulator, rel operon repressor / antitoxin RelB